MAIVGQTILKAVAGTGGFPASPTTGDTFLRLDAYSTYPAGTLFFWNGSGWTPLNVNNNLSGSSAGAIFQASNAGGVGSTGLKGISSGSGDGVEGTTVSGNAIRGDATGTGYGVQGVSNTGIAVYGNSTSNTAIKGDATGGNTGIHGTSPTGTAVYGASGGGAASVYGNNSGAGYGVYGITNTGVGVYGASTTGVGVEGYCNNSSYAVFGYQANSSGTGVVAQNAGSGIGLHGYSGTGWAGYFDGTAGYGNTFVQGYLRSDGNMGTWANRPTVPYVGQKYFATDRGVEYYWNGTYWLSVNILSNTAQSREVMPITTVGTHYWEAPFWYGSSGGTQLYIERVVTHIYVLTTNNGTNYYNITLIGNNGTYKTSTNYNTSANGPNGWIYFSQPPDTALVSNDFILDFTVANIGTPGGFYALHSVYYRPIG